jgi:hypothetical protein
MKALLLTLAVFFCFADRGGPSRELTGTQAAAVNADSLPVRFQPSRTSAIVKFLNRGERLEILAEEIMPDGIWCRIKEKYEPESLGYVPCRTLIVLRDETIPPPVEPGKKGPESAPANVSPIAPISPSPRAEPTSLSPSLPGTFLQALWVGDAPKVLEMLQEGLDPNLPTIFGTRPLIIAAKKKNPEILRLLIEKGADLEGRDPNETSPLAAAATAGQEENVEILIAAGADLNCRDSNGLTPLAWASLQGFPKIVEILLSRGADLNVKSKDGKTALRSAKMVLANTQKTLSAVAADEEEMRSRLKAKLARYEKVVEILEKAGGKE